jgi:hypothetical protein
MADANDVLFGYVTRGNPSSTEHTKRYLRRYPQFRQEIIELAAVWRAISTIESLVGDTAAAPYPVTRSKMNMRARRLVARSAERAHA